MAWLREQGVQRILVRLDKGFFKVSIINKLLELGVDFVLKMQETKQLQPFKGPFERDAEDPRVEVSRGERWGVRMLCVRRVAEGAAGELKLGNVVVKDQATILTNLDVDPVTAWRMYNQGAAVEHRIEELAQLGSAARRWTTSAAITCSGAWACSRTSSSISRGPSRSADRAR